MYQCIWKGRLCCLVTNIFSNLWFNPHESNVIVLISTCLCYSLISSSSITSVAWFPDSCEVQPSEPETPRWCWWPLSQDTLLPDPCTDWWDHPCQRYSSSQRTLLSHWNSLLSRQQVWYWLWQFTITEQRALLTKLCSVSLTSMCLSIHNFINTGLNYLLFPTLCDHCIHPLIIGLFSIICQGRLTKVFLVFFPRNMGPVSPIFHGTLSVAETLLSTLFPLMTGTNFVLVLKISWNIN